MSRRPARAAPVPPAPRSSGALPEWVWLGLAPVALLVLFWASRGTPLGTPVADDYAFLYRLEFHRPLDPFDSMGASRPAEAESLFLRASREGPSKRGPFAASTATNLAMLALGRGAVERADSLVRRVFELGGESADAWAIVAELALHQGDAPAAREAVQQCLAFDPQHAQGRRLAEMLSR